MLRKQLSLFLLISLAASSALAANPLEQDEGPDCIVCVEAEHYDEIISNRLPNTWLFVTETDNGFSPPDGWSGEGAMQSQPTTPLGGAGPSGAGFTSSSMALNFQVNFVKTGTHYVWVLGYGFDGNSDSCHVLLNGDDSAEGLTAHQISQGWGPGYAWGRNQMNGAGVATIEVPSTGVHTLGLWMREDGFTADKLLLTTNPDYVPTGKGPAESRRGPSFNASSPTPADGAVDVPYYAELSWRGSDFANRRNVYFGTVFEDVNEATVGDPRGVLVSEEQAALSYAPAIELGGTYYWRVDEVNEAPPSVVHPGSVWSFTVEPVAYTLTGVTATASSQFNPNTGPGNVVNGSGLNSAGQHDTLLTTMWMTAVTDTNWWIQFAFDQPYSLYEMEVWNQNQAIEGLLGWGAKDVTIETSLDEETWTTVEGISALNRAPGSPDYQADNTVNFNGAMAQYVRITIHNNQGGVTPQTGLSEVRFSYIPVLPREPMPANGATVDSLDVVLQWRAGRRAAEHKVLFSGDVDAVMDGSAQVTETPDLSYDLASRNLDYGTGYFWRIVEVNDAAVPAEHTGPLWSFKTPETFVIDDMEMYEDAEFLEIWAFWVDGYNDNSNGSVVGNGSAPEEVEVYEGGKSMPMTYDNNASPKSEATRTFDPPLDLTAGSPDSLNVYFKGVPYEFNGYYSQDGPSFWNEMSLNPLVVSMSDNATIGLAVTSHDRAAVATGVFTDLQTEGSVSGDWTIEAIGSADAGHPADIGSISGSTATIIAGGNDIWGTADEFVYVYKQFTGDGSITAKVESLDHTHDWAKAGVMIRNSADASASYASVQVTGAQGIRYQYRDADGVSAESDTNILDGTQELLAEPAWIKIERKMANDAASVYLTITDTSNKSVKTAHPDPAATRLGSWTQLSVPLTGITGVNLSSIASITVGVEGVGAVGKLYVDYLYATTPYEPYYDLVAHYKLDGDAQDSSGNGFDGIVSGDPNYVDGIVGQALDFDGNGGEYVTIGTLDPSFHSNQLTVSVFTKWGGLSGSYQGIAGKRDAWDEQRMVWDLEIHRDNGDLRTHRRNGQTVSIPPLPEGEWAHVGATYDGQTAQLYLNGELSADGPFTFGPGTSATLVFGAVGLGGGNPFKGTLDELRIYDRKLTAQEIMDLSTP